MDEHRHQKNQNDDASHLGRRLETGEELEQTAQTQQLRKLERPEDAEALRTTTTRLVFFGTGCKEENDLPRDGTRRIDRKPPAMSDTKAMLTRIWHSASLSDWPSNARGSRHDNSRCEVVARNQRFRDFESGVLPAKRIKHRG